MGIWGRPAFFSLVSEGSRESRPTLNEDKAGKIESGTLIRGYSGHGNVALPH